MTDRSKRALERSVRTREATEGETPPDPVLLARMESAVSRMPPLERYVFLAVRLDDMSYLEIGEQLDMQIDQIERLFARSLFHLMRNLDQPRRRWWQRWLW